MFVPLWRERTNYLTHRFARFKFNTVHFVHEKFPLSVLTSTFLIALNYDIRIKTRDIKMAIKWYLIWVCGICLFCCLCLCSREIFLSQLHSHKMQWLLFHDKANVFPRVSSLQTLFCNVVERYVMSLLSTKYHLFCLREQFA